MKKALYQTVILGTMNPFLGPIVLRQRHLESHCAVVSLLRQDSILKGENHSSNLVMAPGT